MRHIKVVQISLLFYVKWKPLKTISDGNLNSTHGKVNFKSQFETVFWLRCNLKTFNEEKSGEEEFSKLKPFDKWLKHFLCVVVVVVKIFFERRKKIYFHFTRFFLHLLSSPPSLRSSIFLIIFVVDGKTFNLKASLLHPSLCIRILHLNVIIFLLLVRERSYIIFSIFSS